MVKNACIFLIFLITLFFSINCSSTFLKKSYLNVRTLEQELQIITTNAYEAFCFLNVNGTVYDLNSLNRPDVDYSSTDGKYTMYFNFCKKANSQCTMKNTTALAIMKSNADPNICFSLGGSESTLSKWNFVSDADSNTTSLELALSKGEQCISNPSRKFETIYQVICDKNATSPRFDDSQKFSSDSCANKVKVYSAAGCPKLNFYSMFNNIVNNKYAFGSILIVVGVFLCFFGNYFYFILCLIIGVFAVAFLILFLVFTNISVQLSTLAFWGIIAGVVIVGLLVGYFLSKYESIVDCIIGGAAGYFLGLFLYNFALNRINSNPKVVFYLTIFFSMVLIIFLVFVLKTFVIISSTSLIGAYGIIRGISLMAGGFPDENQVMDLISKGEWSQVKLLLTNSVYMYLCALIILFFVGIIIQYKYFNRFDKAKKNEEASANLSEKQSLLKKEK